MGKSYAETATANCYPQKEIILKWIFAQYKAEYDVLSACRTTMMGSNDVRTGDVIQLEFVFAIKIVLCYNIIRFLQIKMHTRFCYRLTGLHSERRLIYRNISTPSQTPSEGGEDQDEQRMLSALRAALKDPEQRKKLEETLKSMEQKGGKDVELADWDDIIERKMDNIFKEMREHILSSSQERNMLVETQTVISCIDNLNKIFQKLNGSIQDKFISKLAKVGPFQNKDGKLFYIDSYDNNGKKAFWLNEIVQTGNRLGDKSAESANPKNPIIIRPKNKPGSVSYLKSEMQKDLNGIQNNLNYWGYEKCPKEHLQKMVDSAAQIFSEGQKSQDVIDMFIRAQFNDPKSGKTYRFVRDQGNKFTLHESR